jgi:hypothetical protein
VADIIGARLAWTVAMISSVSEVDAGRAQVGVPELALDDVARDALAREFNRVGVAELMRREPSSDAGQSSGAAEFDADCGTRPWPSAGRSVYDAEQRAHR